MKILTIIALSASLLAGASTASMAATPYDVMSGVSSLGAIQEASIATVLKVNHNEAQTLAFDNDVASVRARVENNPRLLQAVERQGYTIDQIVGVSGNENGLTLYAL
ncbi:MAG: hypothetical protein ACOH2N_05895 [Devosia sp.]